MEPIEPTTLGKPYSDTLTKFAGIAIARCAYIDGTVRVELQPPCHPAVDKMPDSVWIDERRLKPI